MVSFYKFSGIANVSGKRLLDDDIYESKHSLPIDFLISCRSVINDTSCKCSICKSSLYRFNYYSIIRIMDTETRGKQTTHL